MLGDLGWYWKATRHPLMGLVLVIPLLVFYEVGTFADFRNGGVSGEVRNGADAWLRSWCATLGAAGHVAPPIALVAWLGLSAARRWDSRPEHLVSTMLGMVIESLALALMLWLFSRLWPDLLHHYGWELGLKSLEAGPVNSGTFRQALPLVGAGIYEEFLFRLVAICLLASVLSSIGVGAWTGFCLSALFSAWLFAAAHHWGMASQPYDPKVFSFRFVAGLVFAAVVTGRGFGVAVGGHTFYNLMVGLPGSWQTA
ncbi:MAG: CPBP family glutamic-type intramembrane protease [Planctomycetota bacterium]|nr:CPBP family glutamic-type intramembrane protease [Planctomycetota bacterium]